MRRHILSRLVVYAIAMAGLSVGCRRTEDSALNPNVTKGNFEMISNGMSEAEVTAILGDPYTVVKPAEQSPRQFTVVDYVEVDEDHIWRANLRDLDADAKSIHIGFKDGKVAAKSQTGL